MDYKVMKRPMFKMGGPTSGGTGITSGLETPRQNFKYGTSAEAIAAIPAMFEKTMTGLENRRSTLGPMALLKAAQSGAFTGVGGFGDLAMSIGSPEFLGAGFQGLEQSQKLDTQIDALGLKEATTMATLLKPSSGGFSTRLKSQAAVQKLQIKINGLKSGLADLDPTVDAGKIEAIKRQIGDLTQQMRVFLSGDTIRQQAIAHLTAVAKISGDDPDLSPEAIDEAIKLLQGYAEGGRINKAMGGGMDMGQEQVMPATQTTAPGTEVPDEVIRNITGMIPTETPQVPDEVIKNITGIQPQGEDPFQILRARLPREIPDDVVSLIAYNQKAFADFANIQDQDDVDLFNQRYNVQLVVDLASR